LEISPETQTSPRCRSRMSRAELTSSPTGMTAGEPPWLGATLTEAIGRRPGAPDGGSAFTIVAPASDMTGHCEKPTCPGQNFLQAGRMGCCEIAGSPARRHGLAPGAPRQLYEINRKNLGRKLSMTAFSSAWALLRTRIYKIRTLLSTGFVDNPIRRRKATGRKALPGAASRAAAPPHGEYDR
jgi:hypothetical protein